MIVDNDEMDRLAVVSYAKRFELLTLVNVFDSAEKALTVIEKNNVVLSVGESFKII